MYKMLQYKLQWNPYFWNHQNWFAESKQKMKCLSNKGNNLGFELSQVPIIKILLSRDQDSSIHEVMTLPISNNNIMATDIL